MTSKERILAVWNGLTPDYLPLTTWSFGFKAPPHLRWNRKERQIKYWYSMRLEHIHTLPEPWDVEDDFKRVLAWQSIGVDDILDVSIPWSIHPEVKWKDSIIPPCKECEYPIVVREYVTPAGSLRHAVKKTGENPGEGWVIQPDYVPLIEDYNIPRAIEHIVNSSEDVERIKYLYQSPDAEVVSRFKERMKKINTFTEANSVPVQAWSAFGMDGVVWMTGVEGAIMMAMDEPELFGKLVDIIARADLARTEIAASEPGVDMIIERGWYSSTDFWSPNLFNQFVFPKIKELAAYVHKKGKKFGYVMTTGVKTLGPRLAEAGVDVLYFVDPVQDNITLECAKDLFDGRLTMVGGINTLNLSSCNPNKIKDEVHQAIDILAPTNRFILHPVDSLFPETPWDGMESVIEAWKEYR